MVPHPARTADTWATAASGRDGFYAHHQPHEHFRTSATTSGQFAATVAGLLGERPQVRTVLDVGAGGGHLLIDLARLRPDLDLTGVDLRPRPPALDPSVGWLQDRYDVGAAAWESGSLDRWFAELAAPALVVATEFLDDLPLTDADDPAWVDRWWPDGAAEIGVGRDLAWAGLVARLVRTGGLALMVDYGHLRAERPTAPTSASFRDGRAVPAAVRRDQNLTAHVAVDAVADAGERVGATTEVLLRQRYALSTWLTADPVGGPLDLLVRESEHRALTGAGLGDHWWLLQRVDAADLPGWSRADRPR